MATRRRLIGVIHSSAGLYGADRLLDRDIRLLSETGVATLVVLPEAGPLADSLEGVDGVEVAVDSSLRVLRRSNAKRPPFEVPTALRGCDHVLLNTLAVGWYSPRLALARQQHSLLCHEILATPAASALTRVMLIGARRVICNSYATSQWLAQSKVPQHRLSVLYPALDDEWIQRPISERQPQDPIRIVMVGRLNGYKGQVLLARAFFAADLEGCELIYVGSPYPGQERHEAELKSVCHGRDNVTLRGQLSDVAAVLDTCDVLVVASTKPEGFGLVALEAATQGLELLVPSEGGVMELSAQFGGRTFKPNDEGSLTSALREVTLDVQESRRGRRARATDARRRAIRLEEERRRFWRAFVNDVA